MRLAADGAVLEQSLLKEDAARDVLVKVWGGEEELAPGGAVLERILYADGLEPRADGAGALVAGEEAEAGADELLRGGLELGLVGEGSREGEPSGESWE